MASRGLASTGPITQSRPTGERSSRSASSSSAFSAASVCSGGTPISLASETFSCASIFSPHPAIDTSTGASNRNLVCIASSASAARSSAYAGTAARWENPRRAFWFPRQSPQPNVALPRSPTDDWPEYHIGNKGDRNAWLWRGLLCQIIPLKPPVTGRPSDEGCFAARRFSHPAAPFLRPSARDACPIGTGRRKRAECRPRAGRRRPWCGRAVKDRAARWRARKFSWPLAAV